MDVYYGLARYSQPGAFGFPRSTGSWFDAKKSMEEIRTIEAPRWSYLGLVLVLPSLKAQDDGCILRRSIIRLVGRTEAVLVGYRRYMAETEIIHSEIRKRIDQFV